MAFLNNIFWFIGFKKSVVFSSTITEEDDEEDSDVFADEPNDVDPDELEMAFDNFLDKLEGLVSKRRQDRFDEIMAKSWNKIIWAQFLFH